jgi:hypothetical protein
MRTPEIGEFVVFHDSNGRPHNGLVLCVHSATCINLVHVESDEARQDTYGRQTDHPTSISHGSQEQVHGFYWRYPEEEPNPYKEPLAR